MSKLNKIALTFFLCIAVTGWAGIIKTWVAGDTVSITDLNANFQHIHNSMVGGHGARLKDADVSSTANISYSKIQNGRGIARAFARVASTCSSSPCTIDSQLNITSITRSGTGVYVATLNYTATNTSFAAIAQSELSTGFCEAVPTSTTTVTINCLETDGTPAAIDGRFDFVVFDND